MATSPWREGPPPWSVMGRRRRAHVERVVTLLQAWGDALDGDQAEIARWRRAGWLHDALKDAKTAVLRPLVDAEFRDAPEALWHGPAAAATAATHGEADQAVLAAVRYHTVGCASWERTGRMLFLADYLEPGRHLPPEERRALSAHVTDGRVAEALRAVVAARVERCRAAGRPLHPRTSEWCNALAS